MAGHIRQRGEGSWQLLAYIGYDGNAKKRRYATKTFRGSKREADKALAKFVSEVSESGRIATGPVAVDRVLSRWLDSRKTQLAPSTVDRYQVAIKLIPDNIKKMPVAKLRAHQIEDMYAELASSGQSGSSIRKLHWAMRGAMNWAFKRGLTGFVATDGVELPPLGTKRIDPPSSDDVRTVLDWLLDNDPDWGTLVAVIAWTGCRRGEACGLRWNDIDFKSPPSLLIRRSIVAVPGGPQERGTKTGELRRVAIGSRTADLLTQHRERCEERAGACDATLAKNAYVFSPDVAGSHPYNPRTITRVFADACKSAGVPHMRLHDLRHHSATTLLKQGTAVGEVMDRHGWHTVEMVNRYRHLLEAKDTKAAEALENA